MRDPEQPRHQKKSAKKMFTIEYRYVGSTELFRMFREWKRYRAYLTEKSRDIALKRLNGRDRRSWEYRVGKNLH